MVLQVWRSRAAFVDSGRRHIVTATDIVDFSTLILVKGRRFRRNFLLLSSGKIIKHTLWVPVQPWATLRQLYFSGHILNEFYLFVLVCDLIVFFYQLDAQFLYFNTFIILLYMFRALLCSSLGGQFYYYSRVTIPDAVIKQLSSWRWSQ